MIEVKGLPVQIVKADLDALFSPYGDIQITDQSIFIKIGNNRSTAYVALDSAENERRAVDELNDKLFRDEFVLEVTILAP